MFNRKHFFHQSGGCKAAFLFYIAIIVVISSAHASARPAFSAANLFAEESKQLVGYEAISGPIQYIEDAQGDEGYSAPNIKQLNGRYERKVYDFPENYSAKQLFSRMSAELNMDGYEIIFSCTQQMCGEVPGWKLFLGKWVEGTEDNQYYLLATNEKSGNKSHIIALYINEFSNQPRIIIDEVTEPSPVPALPSPENFAADTVYFYSNSHRLSSDQKKRLQKMAESYQEGQWEVVGFSDNTGSTDYNLSISKRRANEVIKQLVDFEKLSAANFIAIAKGQSAPAATNTDEPSRALNRRVTIQRIENPDNLISDTLN